MKLTAIAKAWITRRKQNLIRRNAAIKSHKTRKVNLHQSAKDNSADIKDWGGKEKAYARNQFFKAVINSKLHTGKVLTLSASTFILEEMLYKAGMRLKFLSCECEKSVYNSLLMNINKVKNARKFMLTPHLGIMEDKIKSAKANEYSHLFLDYCRTLFTHRGEIVMALKKNIVKVGGVITITLSQRVAMSKLSKNNEDTNSKIELMKIINKYKNYQFVSIDGYKDTKGDTMLWAIIKRIK